MLPNATSVLIRLHAFRAALCPIGGFELRYRLQASQEWLEVSKLAGLSSPGSPQTIGPVGVSAASAQRYLGQFELIELRPASWYDLQLTAFSEAGSTQVEYSFATLTELGGAYWMDQLFI